MSKSRGTYASVGIAASHFADKLYQTVDFPDFWCKCSVKLQFSIISVGVLCM